jgi:hypothetical protein
VKLQPLPAATALAAAAVVLVTTATPATATSVAARPFLGGGVVLTPVQFHAAKLRFIAPTVGCAKHASSVVRLGIFGIHHFTNTRTGKSWNRRWFGGLVVRCAGHHRAQDAMTLNGSPPWTIPAGDRIEVTDSYDGHCEYPSVMDETKGRGYVTPCSVGGPRKVVRERPGWRHLLGARLTGDSLATPLVVRMAATANRHPVGKTHHYLREQHLHHQIAVHVLPFDRMQRRPRVVVR